MSRIAVGAVTLCLAVGVGHACTCVGISNATAYGQATDVFVGTVLSVKGTGYSNKVRVRIERSWKGAPAGKVVTVYTGADGASCGVGLAVGFEQLVFARRMSDGPQKGQLGTGLCSQPHGIEVSTANDSLGPPASTSKP
jgi:hypothetical protein